uniref:Uncharacterized protein n=1 Tax=Brassica oleracea var. oleracea TaxID=109376 RepID=A0A0D3E8H9_BRAOL
MLFPIPGTIVRALRHFGLSISQLSVPALQQWLSMLISSYELGMDLNPGDSEGWCQRRMGSLSRRAPSTYSVGSGTSPVDPSVDSCRSFCQARSSPQQAVLLEFLHRRTDLKRGGAPSISSHLSASGHSRQRIRSRKGKGVASENVLGNLPLPEWNPSFSPGQGVEPARFPFLSTFLPTSLPVLLLISCWTKSRGGK